MNDLVRFESRLPATAADMRAHVNLVQEVMKAVMQEGTHYGKIPGTPKPSLWKPGAEVLCATFHIAPSYRIEDLSTEDCARYRVSCTGTHQATGIVMGEGMGSCSSNEKKYKWRKANSVKEFDATPENRRRVEYGKDYENKQVRTEPADIDNTVLKMACKRAQVAMALNVTAASDIFTQDVEDLPEELRSQDNGHGEQQAKAEPTKPPYPDADISKNMPAWKKLVVEGVTKGDTVVKKTPDDIIKNLSIKSALTEAQIKLIREELTVKEEPTSEAT